MRVIHDPRHTHHRPRTRLAAGGPAPALETPERAETLLAAALAAGCTLEAPAHHGLVPILAVHDPDYVSFLRDAQPAWAAEYGAASEVRASLHRNARLRRRPSALLGQVGYYVADAASVLVEGSWHGILASAQVALHGADLIVGGQQAAYALCRPPGHHAYADQAAGFCYLNNAAIAAEALRAHAPRVAILDVDVHHGNGTQHIFEARGDVFFASVHGDPAVFYPFYAGYADERGIGPGEGATLNLPLPLGSGDERWIEAMAGACSAIRGWGADALVVSLGLDASAADPFAAFAVSRDGFARCGTAIGGLALPTLLVQEGGYPSPTLGESLTAVLDGFGNATRGAP